MFSAASPKHDSGQHGFLIPFIGVFLVLGSELSAVGSGADAGTRAGAQAISAGYSASFDVASESILNVHGDSWTATWCDNDLQYVFSDDSKNVDGQCVNPGNSKGYNITFGQLTTSGPNGPLTGFATSCMPEYGIENETLASPASSNSCRASWKATGHACVGSALYMAVSRHVYAWNAFGNLGGDCYADRQKAFDGSIIKSIDAGANWSSSPRLDAGAPAVQFPGSIFGTPSFIQYGKGMSDWLPADGADDYVYAVSNDGYWDNGNQLFLARASRISELMSRASWEYLTSTSPLRWNPLPAVLNSNPSFEWVSDDGNAQDWPTYGRATVVTNDFGSGNRTHWGGHSLLTHNSSDGAYRTMTGLNPGSTYYLIGYAKVTNPAETVVIGVKNYGGPELYGRTILSSGTESSSASHRWDRLLTFTAGKRTVLSPRSAMISN